VDAIGEFLGGIDTFDLLVFVGFFGAFVAGYIQGTIRRLLGMASMAFSFLLAASLKDPVGDFLAVNWTQWPRAYAEMVGFLMIFIAGVVAFTLVIQGTYRKSTLLSEHPVVDEVLGGVLGIAQAALLLLFMTIILDSSFLFRQIPAQDNELPFLRTFWSALDASATGTFLHVTFIPGLLSVLGGFVPESIRALYTRA